MIVNIRLDLDEEQLENIAWFLEQRGKARTKSRGGRRLATRRQVQSFVDMALGNQFMTVGDDQRVAEEFARIDEEVTR